jgi:3'-phosphoadenosine 5'-phosphosulfate sulfotransferase (PAPS reductase)/FAD synthetase
MALSQKIAHSEEVILSWHLYNNRNTAIYVSGGIDSSMLEHLVRKAIMKKFGDEVPCFFMDTGTEFPEVRKLAESYPNVTVLKPTMKGQRIRFKDIISGTGYFKGKKQYGYPFWSKKVSMAISRYRNTTDPIQKELRLHGGINPTSGIDQQRTVPKMFHRLAIEGTFPISNVCCNFLKKNPAHEVYRRTKLAPFIGMKSCDSNERLLTLKRTGCNAYTAEYPSSNPLNHWSNEDVRLYVEQNNIEICNLYNEGYEGTGCGGCTLGMAYDRYRFLRLKTSHPKMYKHYIYQLNYEGFFMEINSLVKRKDKEPFILY